MIEFFRDILSGPIYIIVAIIAIILIMEIIGFIIERKQLEKEQKEKIAVINTQNIVPPINPVTVQEESKTELIITNEQIPNPLENNSNYDIPQEIISSQEVKPPIIVFEDPDQKKE